jgi:hypothetical protein
MENNMNKRIKALAEEAGIIPGIMGLNRFTYFDPEKFAELIVRECASLVVDDYVILEHFGVEK